MLGLLVSIVIGILAGWIAEQIMKREHGLLTNLLVGAVGGLIGGLLIGLVGLGAAEGFIARLASATAGAVLLLFLLGQFRRRRDS